MTTQLSPYERTRRQMISEQRPTTQSSGEDWSLGRTFTTAGTAAWQGARDGLMLDTPEIFYRAARSVGDMFGSEDMQSWAGEGIDDIKRARAEDPFYKVDEDVMNSYLGRSIYGGMSSVISNLTMGGAGAVGSILTGGLLTMPTIAFSLLHGGIYGLSEYDSFVDDAYETFRQVNPELTWQQVQDEVNSEALWSAIAEGGFEVAGDMLLGGLLKHGGKAVKGTVKTAVGDATRKAWRTQLTKGLQGVFIKGPASELPSEMATQWVQTEMRNQAGISNQTVGEALKEAFGATYFSSMLLGGGGALAEHALNAGKRGAEQATYDTELAAKAEEREIEKQGYIDNPVIQSVIGDGTPEGMLAAIGKQAMEAAAAEGEGFLTNDPNAPQPPMNFDPASAEFKESLNTTMKDIGFIPTPKIGNESAKKGIPIDTQQEMYDIVSEFREKCEADKNYNPPLKRWRIGKIRPEQAKVLNDVTGLNFKDGIISFDTAFLKKMFKKHPEVTPELFTMLPYTIANFTKIEGPFDSHTRKGEKQVATISVFDGKRYRAVEVVPGKFGQMYLRSFHYRAATQAEVDVHNSNKNAPPRDGAKLGDSMPENTDLDPTSNNEPSPYTYNTTDSTIVNNFLEYGDKFAKYLKGEAQELTAREATFFERTKKKMQTDMSNAHKLGVVNKTQMARFFDLLNLGEPKREISIEEHRAMVERQLAFDRGEIDIEDIDMDTVNSSLLNPDFADDNFRNAHMGILGEYAEKIKNRDKHRTGDLLEKGNLAIQQGLADPQTLRQYGKAFENMDTVIMTAGMIFEQTNRDVALAMLEYKKTGEDADLANAILKMEARNEMAETISGYGTNAGRALHAMRTIKEKSGQELQDAITQLKEGKDKQQLAAMVSQITTNFIELAKPKKKGFTTRLETIQKILAEKFKNNEGLTDADAKMLNELFTNTNLLEMTAEIKTKTRYERARDMVIDSSISGMLTGLSTHIVNTISGGTNIVIDICDRLFAGGIYGKGSVLNGKVDARVMLGGLYHGLGDALFAAKRAFKTGQSQFGDQNEKGGLIERGMSKENMYMLLHGVEGHLSKEQIEALGGMGGVSKVLYDSFDTVGKAQKMLSSHTMIASDEFMRTLAYSMYRRMYAERAKTEAIAQGLNGENAYTEVMDGKNMAVHEEIMEATRYLVFQDPIDPNSMWKHVDNARKARPELMLIMPFLKTPLNIAKFVGTRTPGIANLFREYREAMSNDGDMHKKQLAESRMLTGSMLWHVGLLLAASGLITGAGPTDDKERELLYNTGWRPNSLHLGDKYYEFTRLDPVATFFSTIASFVEIASDLDHADAAEVAATTMGAALQVVSEKYYLSGVTDFLVALKDFDRYGAAYASRQIANLVPFSGARRMLTRGTDPIMREARGILEAVRKDTPLASQAAAARRTILGEAVKYEGGALGRAFTPVKTGTAKHDAVYDELYRLADNRALTISKPSRYFRNKRESIKLDSQQYSKYLELAGIGVKIKGQNAKQRIAKLIKSPQYKRLSDEQQAELIGKIIREYRKRAKQVLIRHDQNLAEFYKGSQQQQPRLMALLK